MPRKIRSDSLYAKLTPDQRELLFEWLYDEAISQEEAAVRCAEQFGLQPSITALSGFCTRHGFDFRLNRAKELANDLATTLPPNYTAQKRAALAQREFEKAFSDLSTKEIIALRQLENEERIVKLKEQIEPAKLKIAERRVSLLEDAASRAKEALTAIASKGGLSPETLKQIEEAAALL